MVNDSCVCVCVSILAATPQVLSNEVLSDQTDTTFACFSTSTPTKTRIQLAVFALFCLKLPRLPSVLLPDVGMTENQRRSPQSPYHP